MWVSHFMGSLVNGSVLFCAGALCIASSMYGRKQEAQHYFRRCTGALLLVFTAAFFDDDD